MSYHMYLFYRYNKTHLGIFILLYYYYFLNSLSIQSPSQRIIKLTSERRPGGEDGVVKIKEISRIYARALQYEIIPYE